MHTYIHNKMILLNYKSFKCDACELLCCKTEPQIDTHNVTHWYTPKLCNYVCCYFCCKQSFVTCVYFFAGHEKCVDVLLEVKTYVCTVSMYMYHIGTCRHIL